MASMFDLVGQYKAVYDDTELDFESWKGMLELITDDIEVKADNYVKLIKEYEGEAKKFKEQETIFADKRKAFENKAKWLKENLYKAMNELELKEVPNELFKIKIQANGGVAPLVIKEGAVIPKEYQIVTTDVNNDAIREALKTQELDFAYLGERGTHLVIK